MIKKYFTYVPLWLSIIVNILLGLVAAVAFLMGVVLINGLFERPTVREQITGWLIMAMIVIGLVVANYLLYKVCQKIRGPISFEVDNKKIWPKVIIVLVILIVCVLSFFILPDIWIWMHDWF